MFMKVVKSGLFVGLLVSIGVYAEEPQKPAEATEANVNEEVSNRIFDEWKKGEFLGVCTLLSGFIMKAEEGNLVSLVALVTYENDEDLLPEERNMFSIFLIKKIKEASQTAKANKGSVFVDRKTRCEMLDHIGAAKCTCVFKKQEFEKKMQKKSSWWPWNK